MFDVPRWRIFKMHGHPVYLEAWFFVLVAYFAFSNVRTSEDLLSGLLWAPILFISVLWHEYGHALAIDKFGYGKSMIVLQGLGGVTVNQGRAHTPPGQSIVISLAGPAFSFSLTVVFGLIALIVKPTGLVGEFVSWMAMANLAWTVFNLIPIFPMDGGNVMRSVLQKFMKNTRRAWEVTAWISLFLVAALVVASFTFLQQSLLFTLILVFVLAMPNIQVLKAARAQ
ncbi:MAG: site-2 protease family protein [bacterium]